MDDVGTKQCISCLKNGDKTRKLLSEFYLYKNKYNNTCIRCKSEQGKVRYLKNIEKIKEKHKNYYLSNKEKIDEKNKKYYINNIDEIKKDNKNRYQTNINQKHLRSKLYRQNNLEKEKRRSKRYRENNVESLREKQKEYIKNNKEKIKSYFVIYNEKNKNRIKEYHKNYRFKNKEVIQENSKTMLRKQNINLREKIRKNNPCYRLRKMVSTHIFQSLKKSAGSKCGESTMKYLSYSIDELKTHLESLFEPWMDWSNHGVFSGWKNDDPTTWTWQLDHIIPQSDLPYDSMDHPNFQKCWALSNLRPLSAKQNNIDGANRTRHLTKIIT